MNYSYEGSPVGVEYTQAQSGSTMTMARDRDEGAVSHQMNRLRSVTERLDKATGALRERIDPVVLTMSQPGSGGDDAMVQPSRCDHASAIASQVDHLEYVAARLEDLRNSIDL